MMPMTRWNPLAELEEMRRRMDRLLEQSTELVQDHEASGRPWLPAAEIYESDTELVVEIDLPGIPQEDIQVGIEEHTLRVTGERRSRQPENSSSQRCERTYGAFSREFALPGNFDESATSAACEQGVLRIRLPKKAAEEAPRIDIKVR